jgi:hypothetical protein
MKKTIIIYFLLAGVNLPAQSVVFNNMYNNTIDTTSIISGAFIGLDCYNNDSYYHLEIVNDTNILVSGQSYNHWSNSSVLPNIFQQNILLNMKGEILDSFYLDITSYGSELPYSLNVDNDVFYTGTGYRDTIAGAYDLLLSKFNFNNGFEWNYIKDYGEYESIQSISIINKYIYAASSYYTNTDNGNSVISKIDSNGVLLDSILLINPLQNVVKDMKVYNDSTLFLVVDLTNQNDNNKSKIQLISMDTSGIINWTKTYFFDVNARNLPRNLIISEDKQNIYITGFTRDLLNYNYKPFVIKTDIHGNVVWQKEYDKVTSSETDIFTAIQEAKDLNLLACGTTDDSEGRSKGRLVKMDSETGDIIWERLLNIDTFNYFGGDISYMTAYDMKTTNDGSIVVCGLGAWNQDDVIPTPIYNRNDAWLLKADSCGFTTGDYPEPNIIVESINQKEKTVIINNTADRYCTATLFFGNGDSTDLYAYSNPRPNQFSYTYTDTGTYTIKLKALAGEEFRTYENIIRIYGDTATAIQEIVIENFEVNLFPNPTKESLNIVFNEGIVQNNTFINFEIKTITGEKVLSKQLKTSIQKNNLEVASLANGIYYMSFYNSKNNYLGTKKFVVLK